MAEAYPQVLRLFPLCRQVLLAAVAFFPLVGAKVSVCLGEADPYGSRRGSKHGRHSFASRPPSFLRAVVKGKREPALKHELAFHLPIEIRRRTFRRSLGGSEAREAETNGQSDAGFCAQRKRGRRERKMGKTTSAEP